MSNAATNREIATRFFETFSSGDVPAIMACMADGASWHVAGRLQGVSGHYSKAEFGPLLEATKGLYTAEGLRITPTTMVADDERVAVEAKGFAQLPDGRTYEPGYHFQLTIRDGKVTEVREYMDTHYAKETFFAN